MNSNPDGTDPTPHDESSHGTAGRYVLSHKITDSTGVITRYSYSLEEEPTHGTEQEFGSAFDH